MYVGCVVRGAWRAFEAYRSADQDCIDSQYIIVPHHHTHIDSLQAAPLQSSASIHNSHILYVMPSVL